VTYAICGKPCDPCKKGVRIIIRTSDPKNGQVTGFSTEQMVPTVDDVRMGRLHGNDFVLLGIELPELPQVGRVLSPGVVLPGAR
jgi:hypothetical protein